MMFHTAYDVDHLVSQRQAAIRREIRQSRQPQPSAVRVRLGHALVQIGEQLQGPAGPDTAPARRIRRTTPAALA